MLPDEFAGLATARADLSKTSLVTTPSESSQVRAGGVLLGVGVALADLIFLAGVVVPHLAGNDPLSSLWLGLPALVSVFTLPLIAYGAALASGRRLVRQRPDQQPRRPGRLVDVAVLALALAGFIAYVSPWGLAAVSGCMIAMD